MIHRVKVDNWRYRMFNKSLKVFDIRSKDRQYRIGDTIVYCEYEDGQYTGREVSKEVIYMEEPAELKEGYVILSIVSRLGRPKKKKNKVVEE